MKLESKYIIYDDMMMIYNNIVELLQKLTGLSLFLLRFIGKE